LESMRDRHVVAHPLRGAPEGESPAPDRARARARRDRYVPPARLRAFAVDVLLIVAAAIGSLLSSPGAGLPPENPWWVVGFSIVALVLLAFGGMYRPRFAPHFLDDVRSILGATAIAAMSTTLTRLRRPKPQSAASAVGSRQ
jgi:hypothetical protein